MLVSQGFSGRSLKRYSAKAKVHGVYTVSYTHLDAIDNGTITNTQIEVVISNNSDAYALERAKKAGIKAVCISPKNYESRAASNEDFLKQLN